MQHQFWGFWGAHGTGYIGLAATTWVPMGTRIVTQTHHMGNKGVLEKIEF